MCLLKSGTGIQRWKERKKQGSEKEKPLGERMRSFPARYFG